MVQGWPGSLVLAGCGRMGGALLRGWLAGGLPAASVARVVALRPSASATTRLLSAGRRNSAVSRGSRANWSARNRCHVHATRRPSGDHASPTTRPVSGNSASAARRTVATSRT